MPTLHPETYQRDRRVTNGPGHLTPQHCDQLRAALAGTVPNWWVELDYDENWNANIVIIADELDDGTFPTLIVRTDQTVFRLEELRGDAYRDLSEHRTWPGVLRAIQIKIFWAMSSSMTVH